MKCRIYNKFTIIKYVNCPKKTLKGDFAVSRGAVQIEFTQIRWFSDQSDRRLDLMIGGKRHSRVSWKTTLGSQGT